MKEEQHQNQSGDSWMYPYQRTCMGKPYVSPIYFIVCIYGPPFNTPPMELINSKGATKKTPALLSIESWLFKNGILDPYFKVYSDPHITIVVWSLGGGWTVSIHLKKIN